MSDRVNILLVDDRPENLLALEAILEPLGQRLVRALSGAEALRQVLVDDFACILLDVQMPGMNGFETAQLIKSRERSKFIPIIFLTAISKEEEYVFRGYSVGAVDYMFKPFNPDILRSKVMVFVDLYLKQDQLRRQEQQLRESEKRDLELRHMRELWQTEARMAEVLNSAMDAVVTFDDGRRVQTFNGAAEQMFGRPAAQVVGRDVAELFAPDERDAAVSRLLAARGCAAPHPGSERAQGFFALRASGEAFPFEATISCLALPDGHLYTIIGRDVSERKRQEDALRERSTDLARATAELKVTNEELSRRQAELERAMTARSRFYASMSHELRTPINAILGYSTLMLEHIYGPLNEKQAEGVRRTHKAAKHLLELVNDVLDLSKIEAGKIDLKVQPVSFPELIEDLFVTVKPLADERGSTLTLDHQGPPLRVASDPRRVRQVLLNLLSNAIKFGRGRPIIVRSLPRDDGGIAVSVIDEGTGIAPADVARIFDEFVQLGKGPSHEGTGLGLPISQRLAGLLQGRLEVHSVPDEGSTFTLVLPAALDARTTVVADVRASELHAAGDRPADLPPPAPADAVNARDGAGRDGAGSDGAAGDGAPPRERDVPFVPPAEAAR
ncbi:MAG TPA: ATP-binding protein [Gemmatimonadaceae bacterium]|nr:ATP-binding protein [Gemmatimonadaceae bacterium]